MTKYYHGFVYYWLGDVTAAQAQRAVTQYRERYPEVAALWRNDMPSRFTHGCVATDRGRFRPIVIEAHNGIFFGEETVTVPSRALGIAESAIKANTFREWHYHKIDTGEAHDPERADQVAGEKRD